jgi:hypothetical protein
MKMMSSVVVIGLAFGSSTVTMAQHLMSLAE